jgi:hypothetical protein
MTVLIVAYDGYEADIKAVTEAIEARGARAILCDTDALPAAVLLSLGYGGEGGAILIEAGESEDVYTNLVTPEMLEDLRGLHLCPRIVQARVPKALELRVTVVGHRVFTTAVDSQIAAGAHVDWRRDQRPLRGAWRPYVLPMEVEERLLRLLDQFGLNCEAIDLVLTPGGQDVFLEVNPQVGGFWLANATRARPGRTPQQGAGRVGKTVHGR